MWHSALQQAQYNIVCHVRKNYIYIWFCHAVDGPPSKTVPRTEYHSHTWSLPAVDGPTLGMASVEAEKWARKDEAVYAVSLRLGFQGELNNGT